MLTMNDRAWRVADALEANAEALRVQAARVGRARVIDCGGAVAGSLGAGLHLARACLADLAEVSLVPGHIPDIPGPSVQVSTDDPVRACLASQYAGWQVKAGSFFAMGSGPMRAVYAKEDLFHHIPGKEAAGCAVGVLESRRHPTEDVVAHLVGKLPIAVEKLTLLVAPASSLAGTLQVVARSIETALHKLHELKFDVTQVVSGYGVAPLPPVAPNELDAIGRTNDAILYGGRVTLWVRADDEVLASLGPRVPSSASGDHGAPFADVYAQYGDFYKIDPMLFSPAEVSFYNLKTGRSHSFGFVEPSLLKRSFGL
jgi:methenyltetrahydromethanopterin cyclohydrolase